MDPVQTLPKNDSAILERGDSYSDEKHLDEKATAPLTDEVVGDVYDDVRIIDLGEDGKERPIGTVSAQAQ